MVFSLQSIKSSFLTFYQRENAALPEGPHIRAINKKMIQGLLLTTETTFILLYNFISE